MSLSALTLLQQIGSIANNIFKAGQQADKYSRTVSLTDVAKLTRVEPLTVVSRDCITLDYLPDVMQSLLSVFTAYYLQAVSIYGRIDSVRVLKILDRLNPDRDKFGMFNEDDVTGALSSKAPAWGFESMKDMPTLCLENYAYKLPGVKLANEANSTLQEELKKPVLTTNASISDNTKALNEVTNLAVGKMIDVCISIKGAPKADGSESSSKTTIPVSVRLVPALLSNNSIQHILTLKDQDTSLVERFHAWRSGRIEFIRDLMFCQDLIDTHKKALMEDQDGVYSEIIRRANNAKVGGLLTKNPSLVSASNLFIISEDVVKDVERKLGGKFNNPTIRNKAFDNTYAMIIVVVDREREWVTFYQRGMSIGTSVSIRDLKASSKGKGPDVLDLLKSMNMGSQLNF